MPATTAQCKTFLSQFFAATPSLITVIYGGADGQTALQYAATPDNWSRQAKRRPSHHAAHASRGLYDAMVYDVWTQGLTYPAGPHGSGAKKIDAATIAYEREFALSPSVFDTGVMFLVLETQDGQLLLGEYIGD